MKKLTIALALLMLVFLAAPAKSVTQKEMGFIEINTSVTKEIAPDTATITFSVETSAKDSETASAANKEISNTLIENLKPMLDFFNKGDTIQTKNLHLSPEYTYERNSSKKNLVGYTMTNTIIVKTKKLENVPKLVDTAVANKATNVSDLRFYVENEEVFLASLIKEATKKAETISRLSAESLGQKINGVKSINISYGPGYENYPRTYAVKAADSVSGASTPVEQGKVKMQVNINAKFYVK